MKKLRVSACQKVLFLVKILQFHNMLHENRFLDTFRDHSKRTNKSNTITTSQFQMAGLGHGKQSSWACAAAIIQSETSFFFDKAVLTITLSGFGQDILLSNTQIRIAQVFESGK